MTIAQIDMEPEKGPLVELTFSRGRRGLPSLLRGG